MGVPRTAKTLLKVNQVDGFDCPGCAWPEPGKRSHFEFCENGAKAVAEEATARRITPEFFATHSVSSLARQTDYWLGQQGRLTGPMIKRPGVDHYRPISWSDAFTLIAAQLKAVPPGSGDLLHLGPHLQRGRLPLPALRPRVRHQQPARLQQHVPRVLRRRAHTDDRAWARER
jgi:anaerobic selenocysteine-containing dehydrogenase